jgi:hypothetical protein
VSSTSPQAFFFDAQADGIPSYYGGVFDPAFLVALAVADPTATTRSYVLRGDALVQNLCTRITGVSKTRQGENSIQGYNVGYDMELYRTVIWDLADAFTGQWNTLDLESFPLVLAQRRVHCIVLPSLPISLRDPVDRILRGTKGYLGGLELDLGNPLQSKIFVELLVADSFIANGAVHLERGWDGVNYSVFEGASGFTPGGERRLAADEFHEQQPPLPIRNALSDRGRISKERYEGKRTYTIEERVIHAISQLGDPGKGLFAFSSSDRNSIVEADLPEAKFVRYLLNPNHKDGAGKAKFFREVLGIGADDWRYLAAQFYGGLRGTKFSELKIKAWDDGFGASFNCVFPITGLNSRVVQVFTNWIMRPGQIPQLSTARPEEEPAEGISAQPTQSTVVSALLPEEDRWRKIYNLADTAGRLAAEECVPTPMKVGGFPVEMDGMCGSASIRISNARKGFARWVIRSKVGDRHYKGGASIFAYHSSQSIDRAVAYAKAFASVLKLNGIECSIETFLD